MEVLPDPRKPARSVMGILGGLGVVDVDVDESSKEERRVDVACVV